MAAVTTADEIVREDISNLYINLDKRQTPFLSRLRRGEQLTNIKLFSWGVEKYEDGRDNVQQPGIPEGKDVDTFETDKQEQLYGRSQKFWRTPHVTTESNEINDTVADFGKYNKQVLKKTVEQRRNIEKRLLSDSDSRDDDGITGREFQGAGRFINDGVSVGSSGAALTFTDQYKGKATNASWTAGWYGKLWQPRYFDHVVRTEESLVAIAEYILNNPVRQGLVENPDAWQWSGEMNPLPL